MRILLKGQPGPGSSLLSIKGSQAWLLLAPSKGQIMGPSRIAPDLNRPYPAVTGPDFSWLLLAYPGSSCLLIQKL